MKKVYDIEQVPQEESPTEDSESDFMGDAIKEKSDEDQDQRKEFLVEYQEETPLEIQDIQLEEGIPQYTANKTCVNTKKCTDIPSYTNWRNGIYTWDSHKYYCFY
ncbi:hypothetical protein O181_001934 [Austropuccinia psidii MF-1]|uniref:Uncharacterized protein n=1 Tax=Austropuccinia psidii MF-1 TaxID=1389203 RepID=A0A9Q3GCD4_9BASI|nr:hypothetical protein [Austropuccinia psidii MF-1]